MNVNVGSGPSRREPMGELTLDDLKSRLYGTLQRTGVVNDIKAQLRSHFVKHMQRAATAATDHATDASGPPAATADLRTRVIHSLIFEHLQLSSCTNTFSVFAAESGLEGGGGGGGSGAGLRGAGPFAAPDILAALRIDGDSVLGRKLLGGDPQLLSIIILRKRRIFQRSPTILIHS